ncbi:aldehyde ferredoxin oxidoreductase family protein [Chloroflexota bacterium]
MAKGYIGKILFVDLSKGEIKEEALDEKLSRDFIGGYGIGARILYDRQKGGVDPLGPENTLGFMSGPLTGTPAVMGSRYAAVGKSPITGGWGDGSSGGYFGVYMKFAGYDGVFFTGISEKPVYLFLNDGKAELRDAAHLWGEDTIETDDMLTSELGDDVKVACIGPGGEKLSLIACIFNDRGLATAGRSGLGAVMGSKKLKAIAARGNQKVELADAETVDKIRRDMLSELRASPGFDARRKYGTAGHADTSAYSGDTQVKNWGGVGIIDFPDAANLNGDAVIANQDKDWTCWHCPVACEGIMKEATGEYKYPAGSRRLEYETLGAFGAMCLNNNLEAIGKANDICNRYGIDTIAAGTIIAFTMECYENGIITKEDTDGIEMTWGNHAALVAMTEKVAKREGLGAILADGVKVAAEKIGKGAEKYAVHIGGAALGFHDPKLPSPRDPNSPAAARYVMDATPGRHTQTFGKPSFKRHVLNATGLCLMGYGAVDSAKYIGKMLKAITGFDYTWDEVLEAGERIANIRHAFNLREGINPLKIPVHPRITGIPPQTEGPLAGVTTDLDAQIYWHLGSLDWDKETTKPSKEKLLALGLNDIAEELWG